MRRLDWLAWIVSPPFLALLVRRADPDKARDRGLLASRRLCMVLVVAIAAPETAAIRREIRHLIRRIKAENPAWGAPRIHGELLHLGFAIFEPTVSRHLLRLKTIVIRKKQSAGSPS